MHNDRFPILRDISRASRSQMLALGCPEYVPWGLLVPHERQAIINHGQTLQRLADRGGLCPSEICALLENRRWRPMPDSESVKQLLAHLKTES